MLLDCPEPRLTGQRRVVLLANIWGEEPKPPKKKRNKNWEAKNPERAREIARLAKRRAYLRDPEKKRAQNRAYRLKYKDRINAARKAKRNANQPHQG